MQPTGPPQPQYQQPPYQYPGPPPGPYGQPPISPTPPPRFPGRTLRNIIVVLVVVGAVVGIIVFAEYRSSTMIVTVSSHHTQFTIAYILTVDGRQMDSGMLAPGAGVQDSIGLSWWVDNCESHSVVATSSGGVNGPTSDSAAGIVCSGVPTTASLSI
jgi:hypothetical protein